MRARAIQVIAETARDIACLFWRASSRVCEAADRAGNFAYRAANSIPSLIDPDRLECRECGEAGGMHIDCNEPDAGKWTATERAQIEAYHAAQDGAQ